MLDTMGLLVARAHRCAMTLEEFKALKVCEDRRVRMIFTDGQEVIATLVSVTTDLDESRHLIYDRVEWSALPHVDRGTEAYYSRGEELLSCSLHPEKS
jgi:hypothetical protein